MYTFYSCGRGLHITVWQRDVSYASLFSFLDTYKCYSLPEINNNHSQLNSWLIILNGSWDIIVVGLKILGSFPGRGEKYLFYPNHPFQLWGSPSLIFSMCQQPFPQGSSSWGMKLTTYLPTVPSLRMSGAIPVLPLFALMSWKGTTSCFCFYFSVTCILHFNLPFISSHCAVTN
jgi:hypothetical protein